MNLQMTQHSEKVDNSTKSWVNSTTILFKIVYCIDKINSERGVQNEKNNFNINMFNTTNRM